MTATSINPHLLMLVGNGASLNTAVTAGGLEPVHGLEADPELYAKVVIRMNTPGETISVDEALAHLDDHALA